MRDTTAVESPRDRMALAEDAGYGRISPASVFAGTLVALGAFTVLLALAAAIAAGAGMDTELSTGQWDTVGVGGGIVLGLVALLSYVFGGYTAGRMARRAGVVHGVLVFVTAVVLVAVVAAATHLFTDTQADDILGNLRSAGIPVDADEWRNLGTVAGIASLVAMLLGAVVGGLWGERWHGRLVTRALDPDVGPEADTRKRAEEVRGDADRQHEEAADRVHQGTGGRDDAGAGEGTGRERGLHRDLDNLPG